MVSCLIVDDSSYARTVIKKMLASNGHKIVGEAEDGEEAVETFKDKRPELVTMDILMPKKNGIEATKEIKQLDPKCKIIVCSSLHQKDLIDEAKRAGAGDFIIKPFSEELLIQRIKRILEN